MVEGARTEADGNRAGEDRGRDLPARAVGADDQERANYERDREPSLVQNASQKRPGQYRDR
jgi:hypothetical protein